MAARNMESDRGSQEQSALALGTERICSYIIPSNPQLLIEIRGERGDTGALILSGSEMVFVTASAHVSIWSNPPKYQPSLHVEQDLPTVVEATVQTRTTFFKDADARNSTHRLSPRRLCLTLIRMALWIDRHLGRRALW